MFAAVLELFLAGFEPVFVKNLALHEHRALLEIHDDAPK